MVKKTLLTFVIIITIYILFIKYISDPNKYISEHQWQDNQIIAQDFLYTNIDSIDKIIVGSSLAFRLNAKYIQNFYNLSYGGLGVFDGLNTLSKKKFYPHFLFIEMNYIDRVPNIEFNSSIDNPMMNMLRGNFVAFRDGKQPMSYLAYPLGQKLSLYTLYILQTGIHKIHPDTESSLEEKDKSSLMETEILPIQIENYSKEPLNIDNTMKKLKEYISDFEKHGTTIVFFEMPVQYQLCNLPRSKSIRSAFYKNFPKDKYTYIDAPDMKEYETTDGIHLDYFYAEKYTIYFTKELERKGIKTN